MRRITIGSGDGQTGPRLGGRPPDGLTHPSMTGDCRYFLTVPVCDAPSLELSVFINRRFDVLIRTSGDLCRDERVLLLCHPVSQRAVSSPFASELSEHPLVLGPEADDWFVEEGEEVVYSDHKLGGRPYTIHDPPEYIEGTRDASVLGMHHFLQFAFPGPTEQVEGSWPWGDGLFHVFWRGQLHAAEWAAFWEF